MEKRIGTIYVFISAVCILGMEIFIFKNRKVEDSVNSSVAGAHLEYIYGDVKEIRAESIIISLTKPVTNKDDFLPNIGDEIYLFIPKNEVQKQILNNYELGDKIVVSIYSIDNIYNDSGLYSIILMDKGQLRKDNQ